MAQLYAINGSVALPLTPFTRWGFDEKLKKKNYSIFSAENL